MSRQTVLLLFGGESSEHDVSIMSARNVYAAMDGEKYDVLLCYIDRTGKWWLLDNWQENLDEHGGVRLAAVPGSGSFITIPGDKVVHVDIAFPVLHGENGHEDGAVQGLMNLTHIPVIGCSLGASAVCWDKLYTKQLLVANNISVTPYVAYRKGETMPSYDELALRLSTELFVKPTVAGSSVGVSKVHSEAELQPAIEAALEHSMTVLIEKAVVGRELEVAVLGNPPNHQTSGVGEIIPGEEFYSYEDKYSPDSKAQVLTRADLSDDLRDQIKAVAYDAYSVLGCEGLARVDFLVAESGKIYVNELNTLPGFTNISQYPKLWSEQSIRYSELIDRLIELASKK
ncbi:MAG TPA: D-alanine--D-alanine ligase family protein [Candidatus Saccharimonadales bacterium]